MTWSGSLLLASTTQHGARSDGISSLEPSSKSLRSCSEFKSIMWKDTCVETSKESSAEKQRKHARRRARGFSRRESVDSLITDLYGLAKYCNFGTLKDELIRERIVVGLRNCDLSEKLQLDPKLTLEKAMNLAWQRETVQQQQSILVGGFQSSPGRNKKNPKRKFLLAQLLSPNISRSVPGALEVFTQRGHAQHPAPSATNARK